MRLTAADSVSREFFSRLHRLVPDRLWTTRLREWQTAYDRRGPGSGNMRKQEVKAIHDTTAPVPGVVPTHDAVAFLDDVRAVFREAAAAVGAKVG